LYTFVLIDLNSFFFSFFKNKTDSYDKLYCFLYQAPNYLEKIWDPFLLPTEFMRMGVPNLEWKTEDCNSNFEMCDTYPPWLFVPTSTTKAMLLGSSKFRSRGRLPVLTYLHSNGVIKTRNYEKQSSILFYVFR